MMLAALAHNFGRRTLTIFHRTMPTLSRRHFAWLIWPAVAAALFFQLGDAVLFEPDEGRNAEKAREILILQDWMTPHENFHPVLDKPIFFYWLIAVAYKLFGVSEWAARLPSTLAALGTLVLVYRFGQIRWGSSAALWSVLILLTSVEFFVLARVVIFDMALTFFVTLALCAFFEAGHADHPWQRRLWCAAMYTALGAATLIKGLVGILMPGMVIFFYLLLSNRWSILKQVALLPGMLLYFAIVLSWYLPAEARNPGYLRYYIWEEHFGRFATDGFDRGQPWYYFFGVMFVGFMPWSLLLPRVVKTQWNAFTGQKVDGALLYTSVWVVLPFVFFSTSSAKLPHYILPIFPGLALLTGMTLNRLYRDNPQRWRLALSLLWWVLSAAALFFIAGWFYPAVLPRYIRAAVSEMGFLLWAFLAVSAVMLAYTGKLAASGPVPQRRLFALQAAGMAIFIAVIARLMVLASPSRSAQPIVAALRPNLTPTTQVVFYDTYFAGGLYYLRSNGPLVLVTKEEKKQTFLGNFYARGSAERSPASASETILSFQEFGRYWHEAEDLLVIVKEKNLPRMAKNVGEMPTRIAAYDEYLVVSKPRAPAHTADGPKRIWTR
jgi:4-amino-4-deoxy-L-arabinose transferase-like glycosyltransferase